MSTFRLAISTTSINSYCLISDTLILGLVSRNQFNGPFISILLSMSPSNIFFLIGVTLFIVLFITRGEGMIICIAGSALFTAGLQTVNWGLQFSMLDSSFTITYFYNTLKFYSFNSLSASKFLLQVCDYSDRSVILGRLLQKYRKIKLTNIWIYMRTSITNPAQSALGTVFMSKMQAQMKIRLTKFNMYRALLMNIFVNPKTMNKTNKHPIIIREFKMVLPFTLRQMNDKTSIDTIQIGTDLGLYIFFLVISILGFTSLLYQFMQKKRYNITKSTNKQIIPQMRLAIDMAVVLYECINKDNPYITRKQLITAQPQVISNRMNLFVLIEIKSGRLFVNAVMIKKDRTGRMFKINPKFNTYNIQDSLPNEILQPNMYRKFLSGWYNRGKVKCPSAAIHAKDEYIKIYTIPLKEQISTKIRKNKEASHNRTMQIHTITVQTLYSMKQAELQGLINKRLLVFIDRQEVALIVEKLTCKVEPLSTS